eukprot:TRINITY_DN6325_c0_g1_i1.p1 TRINITY_DN6325_c0_g1~~TRINITY_DN6325_c0_g1_i1.p1  ORF type:complete len:311 (-),score=71.73 TRINITY_DN6325_c0_g1_i1:41-973(-)
MSRIWQSFVFLGIVLVIISAITLFTRYLWRRRPLPQTNRNWLSKSNLETQVLPDDMIWEIMRKLNIRDNTAASQVCRQFYKSSRDDRLWRHFYRRDFPDDVEGVKQHNNWFDMYANRFSEAMDPKATEISLEAFRKSASSWKRAVIIAVVVPIAVGFTIAFCAAVDWDNFLKGDMNFNGGTINSIGELIGAIIATLILYLLKLYVLPAISFCVREFIEPIYLYIGHKTMAGTIRSIGIELADHKSTTTILVSIGLCVILTSIVIVWATVRTVERIIFKIITKRRRIASYLEKEHEMELDAITLRLSTNNL